MITLFFHFEAQSITICLILDLSPIRCEVWLELHQHVFSSMLICISSPFLGFPIFPHFTSLASATVVTSLFQDRFGLSFLLSLISLGSHICSTTLYWFSWIVPSTYGIYKFPMSISCLILSIQVFPPVSPRNFIYVLTNLLFSFLITVYNSLPCPTFGFITLPLLLLILTFFWSRKVFSWPCKFILSLILSIITHPSLITFQLLDLFHNFSVNPYPRFFQYFSYYLHV